MSSTQWKLQGSAGEYIHGTTSDSIATPTGVVLIAHGFKGYKDYGMFPWLARKLTEQGQLVHRFNFSHSGMTAGDGPFERPDLFERDTWNFQVDDLSILTREFSQEGLPMTLLGHSRGGVSCLLAAGRGAVKVDGVISLSAPATCNPMVPTMQQELLLKGFIESPSSRTDQMLHVGRAFLQDQLDEPATHDLLPLVETIDSPILVIHGEVDPTVSVESAIAIAAAGQSTTVVRVPDGDHVYNTPNPFPDTGTPSVQLATLWNAIQSWLVS
jgi:pimeloyl-ACP methyl ester carboxylesterase